MNKTSYKTPEFFLAYDRKGDYVGSARESLRTNGKWQVMIVGVESEEEAARILENAGATSFQYINEKK